MRRVGVITAGLYAAVAAGDTFSGWVLYVIRTVGICMVAIAVCLPEWKREDRA